MLECLPKTLFRHKEDLVRFGLELKEGRGISEEGKCTWKVPSEGTELALTLRHHQVATAEGSQLYEALVLTSGLQGSCA